MKDSLIDTSVAVKVPLWVIFVTVWTADYHCFTNKMIGGGLFALVGDGVWSLSSFTVLIIELRFGGFSGRFMLN